MDLAQLDLERRTETYLYHSLSSLLTLPRPAARSTKELAWFGSRGPVVVHD